MDELYRLSLVEAARRLASGEMTSEVYARGLLLRVREVEDGIYAWARLEPEEAIARAREADARLRAGRTPGPLHGVPVGVKDIINTRGIPTQMGSPIYRGWVPEHNAEVVDRLQTAGAFPLGKTVTTEFAFLTPPKTRNPWNPAHTPGGSSSGSAAAVAAGMVPVAIGTQTNGSVIRPAAFCGVVGYKPGKGVLSTDGILPFSPTLDQPGVFARSVEDAGLLVAHLAHSRWTISPQISALKHAPRLVATRTPVWHLASEDQRNRFAMDVSGLREAGAVVDEVDLPASFNDAHKVHRTIMLYEAASASRAVRAQRAAQLSELLRKALEEGDRIAVSDYERALKKHEALQRDFSRFTDDYDAVVTPPAAGEAPASLDTTGDPSLCTIWTLIGVPAIVIPTGLGSHGLPLALQIIGNQGESNHLLATSMWCERQLPFRGLIARELL
ncbi:MAG TPA: amidase [Burkholderiales bacterium]|jgi:Asp-tRNA(Asn)/Glu-tRNA(Gln) amidotransferase A subunit family amidase